MTALGAPEIVRGLARHLVAADQAILIEMPLANGRRADLVAIDRRGQITIAEVKSSRADFMADRKWTDYLGYCDHFVFAIGPGFPREILPADEGCLVSDGYAAEVARAPRDRPLGAARRKAMLLRFARIAGFRLQGLLDPEI